MRGIYLGGILSLPALGFCNGVSQVDDQIGGLAIPEGQESMLLGVLMGAMAFTVIMNAMCWIATRERSFSLGAIYVSCLMYFVAVISGLDFHFVWPNPPDARPLTMGLSAVLVFVFFALTCKSFLAIGEFEPRLKVALHIAALAGLVVLLSIALQPRWVIPLSGIYGASVLALSGLACVVKIRDHYPPSYWFSFAWLILLSIYTLLVSPFIRLYLGPSLELTVLVAIVIQSLVLTYGLVYRLSIMHRQVLNYQLTLETAVEKRTDELEEMAEALHRSNEALMTASRTDALTGCHNRRYLDEMAGRLFNDSARTGSPLSLLVFDADHFKTVNDNFGHDVGDRALKIIARALHANAQRPMDIVARFGGEEFVLILPSTPLDGAKRVAHRIRHWLKETPIDVPTQGSFTVSMSVGVVSGVPMSSACVESYFKHADSLVYKAKSNGRDRVCFSQAGDEDFGFETEEQSERSQSENDRAVETTATRA